MSLLKRVILAFASTVSGVVLLLSASFTVNAIRCGVRSQRPVLEILPVYLLFALPGWIVALPPVVYFEDANGARAWMMLAIGTCIGPALMIVAALVLAHGRFSWQADGSGVILSCVIAFLTTAIYILLLKYLPNKHRTTR